LFNAFTGTTAPTSQTTTGACVTASYWAIGVPRTRIRPLDWHPTSMCQILVCVYTSTAGLTGLRELHSHRTYQFYCDGRDRPEAAATLGFRDRRWVRGASWYFDRRANPIYNLTPYATVDRGHNNWVNSTGARYRCDSGQSCGNYGELRWGLPARQLRHHNRIRAAGIGSMERTH